MDKIKFNENIEEENKIDKIVCKSWTSYFLLNRIVSLLVSL